MRKEFTSLLFVLMTSISSYSENICIGVFNQMPTYGMSVSYNAGCSWTEKFITKKSLAFLGMIKEEKMQSLKQTVSDQLSTLGVHEILKISGLDIYSDEQLKQDSQICIVIDYSSHYAKWAIEKKKVNPFSLYGCSKNAVLNTNLNEIKGIFELLAANDFKMVSSIKIQPEYSHQMTYLVYKK